MDSPKGIVVTGGAGFVGSHLVEHLAARYPSSRITILDNLTYAGSEENIAHLLKSSRVTLFRGDITDMETCIKILSNSELVIHLAAESHVDRSFKNPAPFILTNVLGTQCLIEAARQSGVKLFVHCSTDEVYGEVTGQPATEQMPFKPSNPYAASKAAAEHVLYSYRVAYNVDIRVVRANNIFGIRQHSEKLIPRFTHLAIAEKDITIHGDGQQTRSFLAVQDFCEAISIVITNGSPGHVYNIGTDDTHTIASIADKILNIVRPTRTRIIKVQDRPYNDKAYQIDSTKLRQIGWTPSSTLDMTLPNLIAWYISSHARFVPAVEKCSRRQSIGNG